MDEQRSSYVIIDHGRLSDPEEIPADGIEIGSARDCELLLNHPSVSSHHADITRVGGRFYITDRAPSSPTVLNGRAIATGMPEALNDDDLIQIGPFFLRVRQTNGALEISVSPQPGLPRGAADADPNAAAPPRPPAKAASSIDLFWKKRARGRLAPTTPLSPRGHHPASNARYRWEPTSDLIRPWPVSVFIWSVVLVGLLLWASSRWYPAAFSPGTVSAAHARTQLTEASGIAGQPSLGACTSCHTGGAGINDNCSSCHQAENFEATVTPPHKAHQVGCASCHGEHRGADFSPRVAALKTCTECHDDGKIYNGVRMKTPHPETGFGYPVVAGQWRWRGLDDEELASKPARIRAEVDKWNAEHENQRPPGERGKLVALFHALHVYRVRTVGGIPSDEEGQMQCTSCHSFAGTTKADAETPRTRCPVCHSGKVDAQTGAELIAPDKPNCTSCHVQHVKDRRLWSGSLVDE